MKHKTKFHNRPDVSLSQAINQLKDEILAQVRLISTGRLYTMGGVVELDRELQELQKELIPATPETAAVVEPEPEAEEAAEPLTEDPAAPLAPIRPVGESPKKRVKRGFKTKARVRADDF